MATAKPNSKSKPRTRNKGKGKPNRSGRPNRQGKSNNPGKSGKPGKPGGIHARLLKFLRQPDYRPMDKSELARALEVPPKQRQSLRHAITELESSGQVRRIKKGRIILRGSEADKARSQQRGPKRGGDADQPRGKGGRQEFVGILKFQAAGHAFVDPEVGREKGVFIPRGKTGTGLHGDKVAVELTNGSAPLRGRKRSKTNRSAASSRRSSPADVATATPPKGAWSRWSNVATTP